MSLLVQLRRGEGWFWGGLKRLVRRVLWLHLPVNALTRPIFRLLYGFHVACREGGLWLLKFFWFEPLFRSVCVAVGDGLIMEKLPYINGRGRITLGAHVRLCGKSSFTFGNRWQDSPELVIGDHTYIGPGCDLAAASSIRIGRYCLLSGGVRISDYDGHPIDAVRRRTEPAPPDSIKPVAIGDDVWIGADAKILKGVSIGDRAIIGAGAVVTRSVPPDCIVAGNPARVIRSLV
jgi:acetyltransferase-like isoleucine patch superfamily enzyme